MKCNVRYAVLIPTVIAFVGLNAHPAVAADTTNNASQLIAPIQSNPNGQSYGRWAVEWWQLALGVPSAVNPLTDTTGEHCAERQIGDVWFLAGTTFIPSPVVRTCELPPGKALFFPPINIAYVAFLNDPPETRTEAFVRAAGACTEPAKISVWVDDVNVRGLERFFTGASGSQSPLFNVQMPPANVLGANETTVPELFLSPSAEQGYYLFVHPLPPGAHTIRWIASGCAPGGFQDITYHLMVAGNGVNR